MSEQAVAPHPHPVVGQLAALHHFRTYVDIGVVVVVLALTNLIAHFTTPWASIATVPAARGGTGDPGSFARASAGPSSG